MKLVFLLLFLFSTAKAQLLNPTTDSNLYFQDITTGNFSTTKHGFVPKGTGVGNCLLDTGSWGSCGVGVGGGFSSIGTINSLSKSTNGASSTGSILVMQTADTTNAGLVSVGTQSFSGDKTLSILNSTISGTTTLGGLVNSNGVISGGIVSATTLRGQVLITDTLVNGSTTNTNVSGTYNIGGIALITGSLNSGIVSATTFRGTITNTDRINGGQFINGTVSNTTVRSPLFFGSDGVLQGTLNQQANFLPVSGTGIDFSLGGVSPTTVSTTTVSKIFNEYVTGTWTPSFVGGTSSPSSVTYTTQSGTFTKNRNIVCYTYAIVISAITGGGGTAYVSGTPYVVSTSGDRGGGVIVNKSGWTTNGPDYMYAAPTLHALQLIADGNTANTAININNMTASTNVAGQGCYITSE